MTPDKREMCEAEYGDKKCENIAEYTRISKDQLFSLCASCARNSITKQNKQDEHTK